MLAHQRGGGLHGGGTQRGVERQALVAAKLQLRVSLDRLLGRGVGALEAEHAPGKPRLVLLERGCQGLGLHDAGLQLDRLHPVVQDPQRGPVQVFRVERHGPRVAVWSIDQAFLCLRSISK